MRVGWGGEIRGEMVVAEGEGDGFVGDVGGDFCGVGGKTFGLEGGWDVT